jgi:hypothetical protein
MQYSTEILGVLTCELYKQNKFYSHKLFSLQKAL